MQIGNVQDREGHRPPAYANTALLNGDFCKPEKAAAHKRRRRDGFREKRSPESARHDDSYGDQERLLPVAWRGSRGRGYAPALRPTPAYIVHAPTFTVRPFTQADVAALASPSRATIPGVVADRPWR
jgi:hypothetical protein